MLLAGQPRPPPVVDLGPPHPLPQRLGRADPQLLRDRGDRGPLRRVVRRDLGDHTHRSLPQLQRVLTRSPHSSILLKRWSLRTRRGDSMRITSLIAGLIGLLGSIAAFAFMPTRREHAIHTGPAPAAADEPIVA